VHIPQEQNNTSLLTRTHTSGMLVLVGLFCACNRSLLPYGRPLLTRTHTSEMLIISMGLFCHTNRSLLTLTHTSGIPSDVRESPGTTPPLISSISALLWGMRMRKCQCQKRPTIWQKRPMIRTKETYRYTGIPACGRWQSRSAAYAPASPSIGTREPGGML